MSDFTRSTIRNRLDELLYRLDKGLCAVPLPISLGENCAAGVKIREARRDRVGAFFFDNLVSPIASTIQLFQTDFRSLLQIQNLTIAKWEGHDSVFDEEAKLFFHHYFHLRPQQLEKSHFVNGSRQRRIDEEDIPLFLPAVAAQFAYLAEKLRVVLRSDIPKRMLVRRVSGEKIEDSSILLLRDSMREWGARNFDIVNVYSKNKESGFQRQGAFFIPEEAEVRWGHANAWIAAFDAPYKGGDA